MKFLVVLSAMLACALAKPGLVGAPYGYAGFAGLAAPAYGGYASPAYGYAAHAPVLSYAAAPAAYAAPAVVAAHSAPVAYAAPAPAVAAVAAPAVHTQYHAQDVLGQASYGHSEPFQTHNAVQDAAGNKVGSFSYLSPEGNVFRTDYVADGLGYRVASNALPVGPSAPAVATHAALVHRVRRQIIGHTPAATAPLGHPFAYAAHSVAPVAYAAHSVAPVAYAAHSVAPVAYAAPALHHAVAYGAPAVRPGVLTQIVNTPGHAVSYRVD